MRKHAAVAEPYAASNEGALASRVRQKRAKMPTNCGFQRVNVLLVTDPEPAASVLAHSFSETTFNLILANSLAQVQQQVQQMRGFPVDVAFLDLEVCDVDAVRTNQPIELVTNLFPGATIVAVSSEQTGELAARLLGLGVASIRKPVSLAALAVLAARLPGTRHNRRGFEVAPELPAAEAVNCLTAYADSYSTTRGLSEQQRRIFNLYLKGHADKEIAHACGCQPTTVYEHWRRMARKVGGLLKQDVIADFHRFMGSLAPETRSESRPTHRR